jgi:hypothetical protein
VLTLAPKKSTQAERLKGTAIHEAGHAVAAYYLRVRIKYVTIVPKGDAHVEFGRHGMFDDSLRGIDRAERHIMVRFAGQIAERKHAPRSKWRRGGWIDRAAALELFSRIDHPDQKVRDLHMKLLWRKTECLVEFRWKGIQVVADALLKHKRLDAAQVAAVIDKVHGLKPVTFKPLATAAAEA